MGPDGVSWEGSGDMADGAQQMARKGERVDDGSRARTSWVVDGSLAAAADGGLETAGGSADNDEVDGVGSDTHYTCS